MRLPILLLALLALAGGACAEPVPPLPPEAPRVPSRAQETSLPGPDGVTLRAILTLPEGPATGATVIALHGCAGLSRPDAPLRLPVREADWAARLNAAGHPVLFPDSFGSRGSGGGCGVPNFPIAAETVRRDDARAAAAWVATQGWSRPGGAVLLGWSHGSSTTVAAVAEPMPPGLIRAAIAFYPGCGELLRAGGWAPAVPVLMLLGADDVWTAPAFCQRLAASVGSRVEVVSFLGATHDFDHPTMRVRSRTLPDGRTVTQGGNPEARAAALRKVEAFLAANGG